MSGSPAIQFINVSKSFHRSAGRVLLRQHVSGWFGRSKPERFAALKDITFQVNKGESVAVVGGNAPTPR